MHRLGIALASGTIIACAGRPSSDPNVTRIFDHPERVAILGYDADTMEPFITRDGRYLLFNNLNERTVNTDALEYAACILADGLSLFFNRTRLGIFGGTAIFLATRPDTASPFGIPLRLEAITGFAEGAALSPDERSLYYHRKEGKHFVLYRVTRR